MNKKIIKLILSIFYSLLVLCFNILFVLFVWMTFFKDKSSVSPLMVIAGLLFIPVLIAFVAYLIINIKRVINNYKSLKE